MKNYTSQAESNDGDQKKKKSYKTGTTKKPIEFRGHFMNDSPLNSPVFLYFSCTSIVPSRS